MTRSVIGVRNYALAAVGAAALGMPLYSALAQEHDHSAHAHHGDEQAAAAPLTAEEAETGRALFGSYNCGACHTLGDAGGTGRMGPALDGNGALSLEYVAHTVVNGQGAMPGFGSTMSEDEINTLARYVIEYKADGE